MQIDFHYYAAYCAAILAGYSHEESLAVAYANQFTDHCSRTLLKKLKAPLSAATTQLQTELMNEDTGILGLQNITRIWVSFHFLPGDLHADSGVRSKRFTNKYRLICGPNGSLLTDTVELAKGRGLQAAGLAMHVLSDTWAHTYFAGTPAAVINNTNDYFYELLPTDDGERERKIRFIHNPAASDDFERSVYVNSIRQENENSVMNLGHGRAGHLPDYSFVRYRYMPAWGDYRVIEKDNPSDYYRAFCQMVYALKYLRGDAESFLPGTYDESSVAPYEAELHRILTVRRPDASEDWKALGERLSGQSIEDFDVAKYQQEYLDAAPEEKDATFLGGYFLAAMAHKSMVTHRIFESGSLLAGFSVDYRQGGFRGNRDFKPLAKLFGEGRHDE